MGQKLGALAVLALVGCRTAAIPQDYARVVTRAAPLHPLRVAVLPLVDAREAADLDPDDDTFTYRGLVYRGTRLDDLADVSSAVTEVLARHLAKARTFAQLILVHDASQAPEADLFLSGRLRRLRGYVEAEPPSPKSGRPKDERFVLAEVLVDDVRLFGPDGRARLELDLGWSLHEARRHGEAPPPDPWAILGEALAVAVGELDRAAASAVLDGSFVLAERASLQTASSTSATFGRLPEAPPEGWTSAPEAASAPVGWRADPDCEAIALSQRQSHRFHRFLGPYVPTVRVWACPAELTLRYDAKVEFPALYLGARRDGRRYFAWRLGESNWPGAEGELRAHLGVTAPTERYVFELGP